MSVLKPISKADILSQNKRFLFLNQTRSQAHHCEKKRKFEKVAILRNLKFLCFIFLENGLVEMSGCKSCHNDIGGKAAWAFFAVL